MAPDEYLNYLTRLKDIVALEVVPKTAIFDFFTSHIYKRDEEPEKVEPLICYLQSALFTDITFSIYRIYDRNADRNIFDFVKNAKQYADTIEWKTPLTEADFRSQHQRLRSIKKELDNLRQRRNKYFAHYDNEYFFNPNRMQDELPFSNEDAKSLVRVAQSILSDHSHAFDGSAAISIDGFVYVAAEQLYERLRRSYSG